jgi:hypothetical protein
VPAQDGCLPAGDGAGEAVELGHVAAGALLVEGDEPPAGLEGVGGDVGVPQQLLGEVGGADLACGVAGVEPGKHPGEAGGIEAVVAGQEPSADPVERVVGAAPVAEGVVLGAAADVIERRVGETDHVEVVDHHSGGGQALGDGGGVGLVGIDHHMADPGQPRCRLGREPLGDGNSAASR